MSRLLKVSDLTIDAIRQENKEQGSYFFDQETMKHYGSSFKCNYVYEEIIEERSHYFFFTTDKVISEKLRGMLGGYHFDVYPHLLFDKLCTIRVLTYDSRGRQEIKQLTDKKFKDLDAAFEYLENYIKDIREREYIYKAEIDAYKELIWLNV